MGLLIALTAAGGVSGQTCSWEWVNPSPPRVDIYRLKQATYAFVGVGAAGVIIRSSDGYSWDLVNSGVEGDLFGVDRGAGTFVAVGEGAILASSAGVEWETVYTDTNAVLLDVEFSVSRFVAVGDGLDGNILTSILGFEWEPVAVPWSGGADSITGTDGGFFVAVGVDIWFSENGFEWEFKGSVPTSLGLAAEVVPRKKVGSDLFELDRVDLAWTESRLLWAGGSELWSFKDDGKWTLVSSLGGCLPWSDWLGVEAGPGWALASGISGCPSPYLDPMVSLTISLDGGETFRIPWQIELGGFPGLARYGTRWVAAGALGDVMTSSNGSTWECESGGCSSLACADDYVDLTESDGDWLAVGGVGLCDGHLKRRAGGTTATSADGLSWMIHPQPGDRFRGAVWTGSEYLGVGDGWVGRSSDGETWTTEGSPDGAALFAIGSGDGWIVAVGRNGALYSSDDGHSWLKPFLYNTEDMERVVWDQGQFLALGRGGTIMRSDDAMNWATALAATDGDLRGATAGPARWIIVGDDGIVLTSVEGDVWLPRRSGVDSNLRDVTWAGDRYVAVGWDERPDGSRPAVLLASADGDHWTRFSMPGEALYRIRWTGSSWLAVGGDRTLLTSDCLGTLIEVADEHLHLSVGETDDLRVQLSDEVAVDTRLTVKSSRPDAVTVPRTVTILAGSDTAFVPVTGESVVSSAVLTLTLPDGVGGGSTTALTSVQPPQGTPRTPSGRVTP